MRVCHVLIKSYLLTYLLTYLHTNTDYQYGAVYQLDVCSGVFCPMILIQVCCHVMKY